MKKFFANQKLKNCIQVVIFIAVLCCALFLLGKLFEEKSFKIYKGSYFESDKDFDVIFLGPSHMYNGVLPMELWAEYGISSYNWGYSNSTPAQSYYLLKDVIKYSKPKVVVIDTFGIVEYEGLGNGKYRNDGRMQSHVVFDGFPLSLNKVKAAYDIFDDYDHPEEFLWNFVVYHNRWEEDSHLFEQLKKESAEMGAEFLKGIGEGGLDLIDPSETYPDIESSVCYDYFLKIFDLCKEEGIQVVVTCLPHTMSDDSQRVANSIRNLTEEYDHVQYADILRSDAIICFTDTYEDGGHVNYSGACRTTSWLGKYLTENYDLESHFDDPYWQEQYLKYLQYRGEAIREADSLALYLNLLKNPGFSVSMDIYDESVCYRELEASEMYLSGITPNITTEETGRYCAHIVVNNFDGSLIDEAYFAYEGEDIVRVDKR